MKQASIASSEGFSIDSEFIIDHAGALYSHLKQKNYSAQMRLKMEKKSLFKMPVELQPKSGQKCINIKDYWSNFSITTRGNTVTNTRKTNPAVHVASRFGGSWYSPVFCQIHWILCKNVLLVLSLFKYMQPGGNIEMLQKPEFLEIRKLAELWAAQLLFAKKELTSRRYGFFSVEKYLGIVGWKLFLQFERIGSIED